MERHTCECSVCGEYLRAVSRRLSETAKTHREAAADGENDPKTRWRRALFMVKQLNNRDDVVFGRRPDESVKESSPEEEKHLEAQHWLELIDG